MTQLLDPELQTTPLEPAKGWKNWYFGLRPNTLACQKCEALFTIEVGKQYTSCCVVHPSLEIAEAYAMANQKEDEILGVLYNVSLPVGEHP